MRTDVKLGKKAAKIDPRTLKLARYFTADLPPAPAECDYTGGVTSFGLMLNDQLGDCLVGDTQILAPHLTRGCRAFYRGPIVTLCFESGNRISVTPHHAILTPRGFVPACRLNQGDDAIGSRFPQQIAVSLQPDLNESPSMIEEKFASLLSANSSGSGKSVALPVDFNGDGRFVNGDVDVIRPYGLLKDKRHAALGKPYRNYQIGSTGQLKGTLQRNRASFNGERIGRTTPLGYIGAGSLPSSIFWGHLGKMKGLDAGNRSQFDSRFTERLFNSSTTKTGKRAANILHASPTFVGLKSRRKIRERMFIRPWPGPGHRINAGTTKPSEQGPPTDPQLPSEFFRTFPEAVTTERIRNVNVNSFEGHIYDFSTDSRWYLSNNIISHNCTIAACGHAEQVWSIAANGVDFEYTTPDSIILQKYEQWCGYIDGDPNSDQGGVEIDVLNDWHKENFHQHMLFGYADPDPRNIEEVKQTISLFGCAYIGLQLPFNVQGKDVWDVSSGDGAVPGSWGGHAVVVVKYRTNSDGTVTFTCISWGGLIDITQAFWLYNDPANGPYIDESHALVAPEFINLKTGKTPVGFNIALMMSDLAALGGDQTGPTT